MTTKQDNVKTPEINIEPIAEPVEKNDTEKLLYFDEYLNQEMLEKLINKVCRSEYDN